MNNDNLDFFIPAKELKIDEHLTRSFLNAKALQNADLYHSISQFGVITPVIATRRDGNLLVFSGAKRTFLASMFNIRVPVFIKQGLNNREIFQLILADNLVQEYSFMDWAILLRNLTFFNMDKEYLPILQKIQKKWKYPLHYELVQGVFSLPSRWHIAIALDDCSWQVIYYRRYFSLDEWNMVYSFLMENGIKRNLHRTFLENLVIYRRRMGTEKLHNLLHEKQSPQYFQSFFRQVHSPAYDRYSNQVNTLRKELQRHFSGFLNLKDDPEELSLDLHLQLKSKSDAERISALIPTLKKYWDAGND